MSDDRPVLVRVDLRPRRLLRRDDAAFYVGVSPTKFDQWVKDGRMPKPYRVDGCVLYDIHKLDLACDAFGEDDAADHAWDEWRLSRA